MTADELCMYVCILFYLLLMEFKPGAAFVVDQSFLCCFHCVYIIESYMCI